MMINDDRWQSAYNIFQQSSPEAIDFAKVPMGRFCAPQRPVRCPASRIAMVRASAGDPGTGVAEVFAGLPNIIQGARMKAHPRCIARNWARQSHTHHLGNCLPRIGMRLIDDPLFGQVGKLFEFPQVRGVIQATNGDQQIWVLLVMCPKISGFEDHHLCSSTIS